MTALATHLMVSTNHRDFGGSFGKEIQHQLATCESLEIATGYFGVALVEKLTPSLIKIAQRGSCRLLVGMIFNEGVSTKQKQALEELDKHLRSVNDQSGVFLTLQQFHGKVYRLKLPSEERIYVGSSNLSDSGFRGNLEFNVLVADEATQESIRSFLHFVFKNGCPISAPLSEVELVIKGRDRSGSIETQADNPGLSTCLISKSKFPSATPLSVIEIELRVDRQPNSSLNLYFDKGRKKHGKYSPRPWYEVEVTSTALERLHDDYPIGEFDAFVSEGDAFYLIPMVTASEHKKAIFSRGNRRILGEWIKGKLQRLGHLTHGDRITLDTLSDYGKNKLILKKFAEKKYFMEF